MDASKLFIEKRSKSLNNITTPKGIMLRMNRSIQVEGDFGILKEDYGYRRFLTRGKKNVYVEFLLLYVLHMRTFGTSYPKLSPGFCPHPQIALWKRNCIINILNY